MKRSRLQLRVKNFANWFSICLYNTLYYLCISYWRKDIVVNSFLKQIGGKPIKHSNFGDDLNYYLIRELSGKNVICYNNLLFRYCGLKISNLSCIGSIVDMLSDSKTIIWGAGAIECIPLSPKNKPFKVLAVRGPLTREYLIKYGVDCPETYGDPALLLPYIYKPKSNHKRYEIGIIPHYVDLDSEVIKEIVKERNDAIKVINFVEYMDWHDIIDEICCCKFIISSSLHGLIVSDAYNIPNVWVKFSSKIWGNDFKYHDYYASVHKETSPQIIKKRSDMDRLFEFKDKWKPINIDLTGLMETCPFDFKKVLIKDKL